MKKHKFLQLLFVVFVIILSSCEPEPSVTTSYTVYNSSEHKIDIFISNFAKYIGSYTDTTFAMDINEQIVHDYSGSYSNYLFPFGAAADSISVTFDDTISVSYLRTDNVPRNPLLLENYTGGKVSDDLYEYYYTITEEDYENALLQNEQ